MLLGGKWRNPHNHFLKILKNHQNHLFFSKFNYESETVKLWKVNPLFKGRGKDFSLFHCFRLITEFQKIDAFGDFLGFWGNDYEYFVIFHLAALPSILGYKRNLRVWNAQLLLKLGSLEFFLKKLSCLVTLLLAFLRTETLKFIFAKNQLHRVKVNFFLSILHYLFLHEHKIENLLFSNTQRPLRNH